MKKQKLVINSDMFQLLGHMYDKWIQCEEYDWDLMGQITDKRHNLESRKKHVKNMFDYAQDAEKLRRFILSAEIIYEDEEDEEISAPYDNSTYESLMYIDPVREAWGIASKGDLGDYYEELLMGEN